MSVPTAAPPAPAPAAPSGRLAELRELSRTTPGVLIVLTVAAVLVRVLVGVFTAVSVQSRARTLADLTQVSGPLSVAAQDIYRALSDADATANSAFLSGGQEPAAVRARYESDIAQAEAALAVAVAAREPRDVVDPNSPLAVLSGKLSVYTGLVETARANNHQGLPVGAAYQREASHLMRTQLLPAAERLYNAEVAGRADDQDSAGTFPWFEVVLGLILLGVLVHAQRFVRQRTRRRVNVGLLIATGAALVSLVWVLLASIAVMGNVTASEENGSAQADVLSQARVAALKARGDETLTLVARGSGGEYEANYEKLRESLGDLLDKADSLASDPSVTNSIRDAEAAANAWYKAHRQIRKADDTGDYQKAVTLTIGGDENGAAAHFDRVDETLRSAITTTNDAFEAEVSQGSTALTGTVLGVIVLALIAAAGAVAGIWQRLTEYR